MHKEQVIHEQIRFGQDDYLAGVLSYPADREPELAVLICSPHPNFGGDMENNVVAALAERLAREAVTLRFDYRGVGASRIDLPPGISVLDYWDNLEQTLDYTEPLADAASAAAKLSSVRNGLPMIAVGYSFGAIMGTHIGVRERQIVAMAGISPPLKRVGFEQLAGCRKPCLLVSGQEDFVYDAQAAAKLIETCGRELTLEKPPADHFFIGLEAELADRVAQFVHAACLEFQPVVINGSK